MKKLSYIFNYINSIKLYLLIKLETKQIYKIFKFKELNKNNKKRINEILLQIVNIF